MPVPDLQTPVPVFSLLDNPQFQMLQCLPAGNKIQFRPPLLPRTPPSAIFAASDPIAIGAMRALKQYDIKIPEDISIIGFDNIETTNYTDPPLTTVFAPTFDMGFMAARQLFDAFKHNENISPIKILLPCFLIERNSCI